jgi:hypothetical protein
VMRCRAVARLPLIQAERADQYRRFALLSMGQWWDSARADEEAEEELENDAVLREAGAGERASR